MTTLEILHLLKTLNIKMYVRDVIPGKARMVTSVEFAVVDVNNAQGAMDKKEEMCVLLDTSTDATIKYQLQSIQISEMNLFEKH